MLMLSTFAPAVCCALCPRVGVTEDSVHKRDAKLFEKLQLKLTKVMPFPPRALPPLSRGRSLHRQRGHSCVAVSHGKRAFVFFASSCLYNDGNRRRHMLRMCLAVLFAFLSTPGTFAIYIYIDVLEICRRIFLRATPVAQRDITLSASREQLVSVS